MTMTDTLATFCTATSVAASATTTTRIGSQIDLQTTTSQVGVGQPIYLVIVTTTEIITGGTAGVITFKLASDSSASVATDGSATDLIVTRSYVTDDSAANSPQLNAGGVIHCGPLPAMSGGERYLGLLCVTTTTTTTVGAVSAFLTTDPSAYMAYPNGI